MKKHFYFFILFLNINFIQASQQSAQDFTSILQPTPSANAFLYDGSMIELISKKNKKSKISFDPIKEHTSLSQIQDTDRNVASYSLMLLARNQDASRDVFRYFVNKTMTQSFAQNCSSYHHVIARLFEHNRHHDKNCANALKTMIDDKKSHVCGQLHHSEQGIMIDLHDHIKDYIFSILRENPRIDKIYGLIINIYSTNDVCGYCGPMIEEVIKLLKADVIGFLSIGKCKTSKRFSLLSCISSTKPYNNPLYKDVYSKRPNLEPKALLEDKALMGYYLDYYKNHENVKKGPFSLKTLDLKILFFYTPRPEFQKIEGLSLSFSDNQMGITANQDFKENDIDVFIKLINETPQPLNMIDLTGYQYNFDTLNLSYSTLKSAIIPCLCVKNISFGNNLVTLNLRKSLNDIKNKDERLSTFNNLKSLSNLETLDISENNVNVTELWTLIKEKNIPNITKLIVQNNCVFDMTDNSIKIMEDTFSNFLKREKKPLLDLTKGNTPCQNGFTSISKEYKDNFLLDESKQKREKLLDS